MSSFLIPSECSLQPTSGALQLIPDRTSAGEVYERLPSCRCLSREPAAKGERQTRVRGEEAEQTAAKPCLRDNPPLPERSCAPPGERGCKRTRPSRGIPTERQLSGPLRIRRVRAGFSGTSLENREGGGSVEKKAPAGLAEGREPAARRRSLRTARARYGTIHPGRITNLKLPRERVTRKYAVMLNTKRFENKAHKNRTEANQANPQKRSVGNHVPFWVSFSLLHIL